MSAPIRWEMNAYVGEGRKVHRVAAEHDGRRGTGRTGCGRDVTLGPDGTAAGVGDHLPVTCKPCLKATAPQEESPCPTPRP